VEAFTAETETVFSGLNDLCGKTFFVVCEGYGSGSVLFYLIEE